MRVLNLSRLGPESIRIALQRSTVVERHGVENVQRQLNCDDVVHLDKFLDEVQGLRHLFYVRALRFEATVE